MNTTLTTERRHSPPLTEAASHPIRHLTLLDRAALHLGLALIRWGRRSRRELARDERRATAYERHLTLLQREIAYEAYEHARLQALALTRR